MHSLSPPATASLVTQHSHPPPRLLLFLSSADTGLADSLNTKSGTAEANESDSVGAISQRPDLARTPHKIEAGLYQNINCAADVTGVGSAV